MFKSYAESYMNMRADIYIQKNCQSDSGTITRKWLYEKTISCKAEALTQYRFGMKKIDQTPEGFVDNVDLRIKTTEPLSRRWRITGIKGSDGKSVFREMDKISEDDTIFEIRSVLPVTDPFGKISYYEVLLRRATVQNNDIYSN